MRGFSKDKRGVNLINQTVIFIILNILFLSFLFFFVARAATGTAIYEQKYAKQIALVIDNSQPSTSVSINIEDINKILKKSELETFKILNLQNNQVTFKLTEGEGYTYPYFSNYNVEGVFERDNNGNLKSLILNIEGKNE